jgi:hypothetical protein
VKEYILNKLFISSDPASSTTKTGRYDIAEILLKVALKHQESNQIISSDKRDDIYGLGNAYDFNFAIINFHLLIVIAYFTTITTEFEIYIPILFYKIIIF